MKTSEIFKYAKESLAKGENSYICTAIDMVEVATVEGKAKACKLVSNYIGRNRTYYCYVLDKTGASYSRYIAHSAFITFAKIKLCEFLASQAEAEGD